MRKVFIAIIASLALCFWGCEIERQPFQDLPDEQVFSDELGVQAAALGTYALLKENTFMRPYHFHGEYGGDNIALSGSTTDYLYYMYNYQHVPNNYHLNDLWETSYKGIVNSNKVIENAEKGLSPRMDHVIGEMYYLRAFFYFTLVNIWGRPYTQSPETNLGVPIILDAEPDVDNLPPRAKVAEVYSQIVSDLKEAASLMGEYTRPESEYAIFASQNAAWALLSRAYLYMNDNENAILYADSVINSGMHALLEGEEYTKFPTFVPEENSETIFACRSLKDEDDYNWYAVGGMYAEIEGVGWGEMYASQPYRELLGQNPEDLRNKFIDPQYAGNDGSGNPLMWIIYTFDKTSPAGAKMFQTYDVTFNSTEDKWQYVKSGITYYVDTEIDGDETKYFIMENGTKTYVTLEKKLLVRNGYPKYFVLKCSNQEGQPQLWSPVISRLAEMYLNRAEANAKLGNDELALDDVNVIRNRAGIPEYTEVPLGRTALEVTLDERRLELAFESHRRYDIFRNGLTLDRRYPGTHDRGTALLLVPPGHNRVVDFIPQDQILAQPNLIQNP